MMPVLMDVDTGVDDAIAMIAALHMSEVALVGVTTVTGNVDSLQAAKNSRLILDLFGATHVRVAVGEPHSLFGTKQPFAEAVHGKDGLGGISKSAWRDAAAGRAGERIDSERVGELTPGVAAMIDAAAKYGSDLTIVATGPQTNVARALRAAPEIMSKVGRLLVMAGAVDRPGNVRPHCEFNAFCDPLALSEVLASGINVVLFPLNVTEQVRVMSGDFDKITGVTSAKVDFLRDMCRSYTRFYQENNGFDGFFVHDALPVIYLRHAQAFKLDTIPLEVAVEGEASGKVSRATAAGPAQTAQVAIDVDSEEVLRCLWDTLGADQVTMSK